MLEERTIIDQYEVRSDGTINIRFGIQVLKDGAVISNRWHRTWITPGTDVDQQIAAVNADITARPELLAKPVDTSRIPELKAVATLLHTPAVVKAYRDKEAAERAAVEARLGKGAA